MRDHLDSQLDTAAQSGIFIDGDTLIFRRFDVGPMLPDTLSKHWERLMKRLGLRGIRLHDAHHTHASLMLKAGVHPKIVQERLGHSSISLTLDTYSHVAPGPQEAAARHFDEPMAQQQVTPTARGE